MITERHVTRTARPSPRGIEMGLRTEGKEEGAALPWHTQVPAAPGVSSTAGRPQGRQGLQGQARHWEARLSCRSMGVGAEIKGKAESSAKRRAKVPLVLYGRPDRQTEAQGWRCVNHQVSVMRRAPSQDPAFRVKPPHTWVRTGGGWCVPMACANTRPLWQQE